MSDDLYRCPQCGNMLTTEVDDLGWIVFCSFGPCKSAACEEGAEADTLELAYEKLKEAWASEEQDEPEEDHYDEP